MSSIRERLLGATNDSSISNTSIRERLELNSSYYKNEYKNEINKRNQLQKNIQKSTYEKGVQTTVTPFSTQRNILPIQEQSEITKSKKFEITAGQDKLKQNKDVEKKYQDIQQTNEYKKQMKELEEQSNKVGYAKYEYDKQRVAEDNIGWYDKSIGRLVDGFGNLFDYNGGLVKNENGDLMYLPTFNQMKNEKVRNEYDTAIGRFAGDVLYESGKIAGSTLINQVLPGVGSTVYFGKMFVDSTNQAITDGYDSSSATIYGLVNVGLEYSVGKLLGSATKGLTGGKTSSYEKLLNKAFSKVIKKPKIASILANAGSEATEEFIQEYLDNLTKLAVLEKSTDIKDYGSVFTNGDILADALYIAAISSVTGGVIGTISGKDTNVDNNDVNLYDTFKKELEETKQNTTDKETINKIDSIIENIDNIQNNTNLDKQILEINNKLEEYQTLNEQNKLSREQQQEMAKLQEQLNTLQNQVNNQNTITTREQVNVPTVNDIVAQEQKTSNVNLPSLEINSGKVNLPTVNDLVKSNVNTNQNTIQPNITQIKPQIIEEIKAFQNNAGIEERYSGNNVIEMMRAADIEVPTAFNYVTEVKTDMTYTTTQDLTQNQHNEIKNALSKLKNYDITSINNINQAIMPVDISKIRQVKGNIPINQELLNKYYTVKEIFENETDNFNGDVNIRSDISELNNLDVLSLNPKEAKKIAYDIFKKYNSKTVFENNGNKITVSRTGINESIEKIFSSANQRSLLKEHFKVFSDLGDIIEHATLVNQTREIKNRQNINSWNYYFEGLTIDGEVYDLEFDVRSLESGENQYRVQRLQKKQIAHSGDASNNTRILPAFEQSVKANDYDGDTKSAIPPYSQSASYGNNITQSNENVKLPTINNMQNKEKNTINMPPVENKKIMNPNEISKMAEEDANTTPILPTIKVSSGTGESKFASNIEYKTDMLTETSKDTILSDSDVNYYQEVTNQESLEKAYERLNKNGRNEVMNWLSKDSTKANSTDVAEGWILLKQYQDNIAKETDLIKKDELNRSMIQVAKKMREIGTKAGQTVQAFNILNRLTPEGMVYYAQSELSEAFDNMTKNKTKEWIETNRNKFELTPEETQFIMDTMKEVQQIEDGYYKRVKIAEIQKVMTDKLPPSRGAGIKAWMRISMLFNPKTQVRNVMGNAIIAPVNTFSDLFASIVDSQIAKRSGVRTTGKTNLKNYAKGFKKGAFESYNDFKKGINTRNIQGNRFEITEGKSFDDNTSIGKALNRVDSLLSFMLDAGDRTFYEATFTNSINNQLILNNTDVVTQEMIDIATSEALSRTWQDNNNYTKFVLSVRNMLNNVNIKGYGLGDVLIPFAKTPANLTKAIVDYSPVGLIKTVVEGNNLRKALTNGQYTAQMQHQFVQDLGKATAGTMLYVLGYALAKAGVVSGESDDDKDVANFMKNTLGVSSYSIKIGNKSFTYDWAQPIAAPLSIMANVVNSKNKETALLEGVVSSLDSAGSILLEQSFLQSINDVLNSNDGIVSGIINEVLELPSRAVPTLMKQIADLIDPVQRTSFEYGKPIESAINSIKAKIPFASKTLAPSVDTMGREIKKYGGKNNIFNVFLNPANVNTENISKSAEEIYRLYKSTGETNIMPRVAPYYVNQNGEKITLNSEQRAEYQKISGEIIEKAVENLLNNSKYQNLSDTEKAEIVNKIVNYSYNKAREKILNISMSNEYNKINLYIEDGGTVSDYYLNKEEIDYSYNYPGKYKTLIQITSYDKYLTYQNEIDTIKDKYENTNQRKNAVINYVNSLNLSIPQKAMLIKMNYSSFDSYNWQIIEYINNQDLSKDEKAEILAKLGFTVKDGRVYY